jgi:hypothetical protein
MPLGGFTGVVRVAEGVGDGDRGDTEADVGDDDGAVGVGAGAVDSVAATVSFDGGSDRAAANPGPYW